jgi:uncharacterized protein YlxP (DUF503 family)
MKIAVLRMHIQFPGSDSLKAKRRRLKPLLTRLHREFNVSVAEVDFQDRWHDSMLCCATVNTENGHIVSSLQSIARWVETHWPDATLVEEKIEVLQ